MFGRIPSNLKSILTVASLAVLIVSNAHAVSRPAPVEDLIIGGTGAALGTMQKLADAFAKTNPNIRVKILSNLGSGGGIKALMAGQLTVSVSSRAITSAQKDKGLSSTEIARTPFVFATSLKTPIVNVTLDELAGLYSGKTTNWSDGTRVRPVLRPTSSGDTRAIRDISSAMNQAVAEAHARPGRNIAVTDTESADELEKIAGSIGTSTLSLIKAEGRQLKALALAGVEPTIPNALSGRYPYLKSIHLVLPADPSPSAQLFAKFIRSGPGKAILAQTGNIPASNEK